MSIGIIIIFIIVNIGIYTCLMLYLSKIIKSVNIEFEEKTMNTILNYVSILVGEVNQTVVSKIKEERKDGKLTKEEQKEILSKVSEILIHILNKKECDLIEKRFPTLKDGCNTLIENEINNQHIFVQNSNNIKITPVNDEESIKNIQNVGDIIKNLLNSVSKKDNSENDNKENENK